MKKNQSQSQLTDHNHQYSNKKTQLINGNGNSNISFYRDHQNQNFNGNSEIPQSLNRRTISENTYMDYEPNINNHSQSVIAAASRKSIHFNNKSINSKFNNKTAANKKSNQILSNLNPNIRNVNQTDRANNKYVSIRSNHFADDTDLYRLKTSDSEVGLHHIDSNSNSNSNKQQRTRSHNVNPVYDTTTINNNRRQSQQTNPNAMYATRNQIYDARREPSEAPTIVVSPKYKLSAIEKENIYGTLKQRSKTSDDIYSQLWTVPKSVNSKLKNKTTSIQTPCYYDIYEDPNKIKERLAQKAEEKLRKNGRRATNYKNHGKNKVNYRGESEVISHQNENFVDEDADIYNTESEMRKNFQRIEKHNRDLYAKNKQKSKSPSSVSNRSSSSTTLFGHGWRGSGRRSWLSVLVG